MDNINNILTVHQHLLVHIRAIPAVHNYQKSNQSIKERVDNVYMSIKTQLEQKEQDKRVEEKNRYLHHQVLKKWTKKAQTSKPQLNAKYTREASR